MELATLQELHIDELKDLYARLLEDEEGETDQELTELAETIHVEAAEDEAEEEPTAKKLRTKRH